MKVKPVKAWAILCPNGKLREIPTDGYNPHFGTTWLFRRRQLAYGETLLGQVPVPVLITPHRKADMQTLEEKAVMVAKALVGRRPIFIDGNNRTPCAMYCGEKIRVQCGVDAFDIDSVDISLTPPPPTLKACGHCGASAQRQTKGEFGDRLHQVICSSCLMCTPWCSTEDAADAIWNRRPQ